jgi:hypothetical protein
LHIVSFGLATRSGAPLEAFRSSGDELCLVADAELQIDQAGGTPMQVALPLGLRSRADGLPPPLCASLDQWAQAEGKLAREAVSELAELIAALVLHPLQASVR